LTRLSTIVIAGAGQAGFQAAASLRQAGFRGELCLVGDEAGLPYQRPPLSKAYLSGKLSREGLLFRAKAFFSDNDIRVIDNTRVTKLDRLSKRVMLSSGEALHYDHLILALGARNRALAVEGRDLDGVFGLRTVADVDRLRVRLKSAGQIVVVGAGFIGGEFAAVASALGKSVLMLEAADRVMGRAVSADMSEFFHRAYAQWGVHLVLGHQLKRIVGQNGSVSGIVTEQGLSAPADVIVYGIGAMPNVELAVDAGLEAANGIRVNDQLVTSDPAISAIGDCSCWPAPYAGCDIRLESVQNAADQGRAVAARIMGSTKPYSAVPWFWSDQRDVKLQIAGFSPGSDRSIVLGDPEKNSFSVFCFRKGEIVAVESVNRTVDHMAARKLFERTDRELSPDDVCRPGFSLKDCIIAKV